MKKKLLFSLALVLGAFMAFAQKPVDVAGKYLDNYTYPFTYVNKFTATGDTVVENNDADAMRTSGTVNVTVGGQQHSLYRFRKLGGPWKTNLIGEEGNLTGWHVDLQKGANQAIKGTLTIVNGWDGFAAAFENQKVYQTTKAKMPAGKYNFKVNWGQDRTGSKWAFFVVSKGTALPDTAALVAKTDPNVLGYVRLSDSTNVVLDLPTEQNVTIGLVASFPEHAEAGQGYCVAMGSFEIIIKIAGLTDYTEIKKLVKTAEGMTAEQYPIGNIGGTYPKAKWDAFVAARTAAKTMVDAENTNDPTVPGFKDTNTQAEVNTTAEALKKAIEELNDSFILPFKLSTADKTIWYLIHDRRGAKQYWTIGEALLGESTYLPRLIYEAATNVDESLDKYQFKFVKNPDGAGYLVYSKTDLTNPLSVNAESANFIQIKAGATPASWNVKATVGKHPNYYRVHLTGDATKLLNTYGGQGFIGFYNPGNTQDAGNDFLFKRIYEANEINMTELKIQYGKVLAVSSDDFVIGTEPGQFSKAKWDAFVTARENAKTILEKEDTPQAPNQAAVDAASQAIVDTYENLLLSMNPPVKFSTSTEEFWYTVKDKRESSNYWNYDVETGKLAIKPEAEVTDLATDEGLHFKFIKPANATGSESLIYSKADSRGAITYYIDGGVTTLFANENANNDTAHFVMAKTPVFDKDYYIVYVKGHKTKQLNSHVSAKTITFWNPGTADDEGNDWKFIPVNNTGVETVSAEDLGIYVSNGVIKSKDDAEVRVYNVNGQKLNALRRLEAGVYFVSVEGKQGTVKVIVK